MDRTEFTRIVGPLVLALGRLDAAGWTVYFQALSDVPPQMLEAAVGLAMKQDRTWLPKPGELRALAEQARHTLFAAHPYQPCEDCNRTGWVELDVDGVRRVERCRCRSAWTAQLDRLGLIGPSLSVPKQLEAGELESFDARLMGER